MIAPTGCGGGTADAQWASLRVVAGVGDNVTEIYGAWGYTKDTNKKFRR